MSEKIDNGWTEWRRYVLNELEQNNGNHASILSKLNSIERDIGFVKRDIAILQVKASIWGLLAGLLGTIGVLLVGLIK